MQRIIRFFKNTTVRIISISILVLFALSLFIFYDFYKNQVKKGVSFYYVYKGDKSYKAGKIHNAIELYKKALVYHPKHYKARYNLANIYVVYEDYYRALNQYEEALKIKPDFMIARIDYALVLSEGTFDHDKAIKEYEKAIEKKPKWLYIPFFINNRKTYKLNKAVANYNMGLAYRAKSLLAGEAQYDAREYLKKAVESYKKALKDDKNYETYYNLGLANQLLKENKEAGKSYCKAIAISPLNYEAHYNLAILLAQMKLYKYSIQEFKKAGLILDVDGDSFKTRFIYGVLNEVSQKMVQEGDYDELVNDDKKDKDNVSSVDNLEYSHGKVIITDAYDKSVMKSFKTCAGYAFFE